MIVKELLSPSSVVVVGASNNVEKPGGKVLKNLLDGNYKGLLYCVNPKENIVQGVKSYNSVDDLPNVDLAIIAIAADYTPEAIEVLAHHKSTKAFIIISAGFSEEGHKGAELEKKIVDIVNRTNGTLIGPNCTGVLTPHYHGIFTLPIPKLDPKGCDFISGSGATACFILESGIPKGLIFSRIFAVGNSAQTGVEEILEYMDESFDPEKDSRVKLLYIENISKPQKLFKHASSLIQKGCRIAAIKAGSSEAGSRAASSHTGALASPDLAVDILFKKAGIVRCYGREELVTAASIFMYPELNGKNIAIVTHAGGPAVMLTDALSNGGLNVPRLSGVNAKKLLEQLYKGSSVANPIDFLATGTPEQLSTIIDTVDKNFDEIDGMAVIFGTPGLTKIFDAYRVLDEKIKTCRKPVFPILTSPLTAKEEVAEFISKGRCYFSDEVIFGTMLARISKIVKSEVEIKNTFAVDKKRIREIIEKSSSGYLSPRQAAELLDAAGIPRVKEETAIEKSEAVVIAEKIGYPVVMKVVGPVHKSDAGGVILNVKDKAAIEGGFEKLMKIDKASGVLIQPMLSGIELFAGAKFEPKFGHMVLCGLGGIFVEVLKDVSAGFVPISKAGALMQIRELKGYKIIKGVRGRKGINEEVFADILCRLSALLEAAPEIVEMDINPLLGNGEKIIAVDSRIRVSDKSDKV